MVPHSSTLAQDFEGATPGREPDWALPVSMAFWARAVLVAMALCLVAVFATAYWINPYGGDGAARSMATHQQLGLPPCTFLETTGMPCPSCGMTTSFSLLAHGDVANSLRANWVGTLLAVVCLAFIPWAVASVVVGRTLFIRSVERAVMVFVLSLLGLMLLRWAIVLLA